nr:hypothetical protein [Tetragenococcus halophilus]
MASKKRNQIFKKQLGELEQSLDQKVADKRQELEREYNNKLAALKADSDQSAAVEEETAQAKEEEHSSDS